ncbi:MAG: hypothetical protein LIO95_10045 [Clostridiales bacterium]|nr:hypothetical protein [Clostridiales bacterium]
MEKQEIIVRIGGLFLTAVGAIGIATGVCDGPRLLILPGALFLAIGVLAMATGNM